jgi:glycosidase
VLISTIAATLAIAQPINDPTLAQDGAPGAPLDAGAMRVPGDLTPAEWPRDAVFYQIFVRSFADSTEGPLAGDGVGDLRGIIERLDYLNDGDPSTTTDLGVTGIWLLPIMQSPSYHGYDTTDYKAVDNEYGTAEDLRDLVDACHARGVRVILDLVPNHASWDNPWFLDALSPDSPKRGWFVWSDTRPETPGPWGQLAWHPASRVPGAPDDAAGYYYAVFWHGMPDLNYENPAVGAAMIDIGQQWIREFGIDGYRLDAIKYLIEDGAVLESTEQTIDWFAGFNAALREVNPASFTVGEVWSEPKDIERYLARGSVDSAFDFPLAGAIVWGLRNGEYRNIKRTLDESWALHRGRASTFLTNHDQERAATTWELDRGHARPAAALLMTVPGIPFLYYGEEIGMQGAKPDENIRTPMQWSATQPNAGFSTAEPWRFVYDDLSEVNVETQSSDDGSLLSYYRRLIALRGAHEALRRGDFTQMETSSDAVIGFVRATEHERLLVLVNVSNEPIDDYLIDAGELGVLPETPTRELLEGAQTLPPKHEGCAEWQPVGPLPPRSAFVVTLPL